MTLFQNPKSWQIGCRSNSPHSDGSEMPKMQQKWPLTLNPFPKIFTNLNSAPKFWIKLLKNAFYKILYQIFCLISYRNIGHFLDRIGFDPRETLSDRLDLHKKRN